MPTPTPSDNSIQECELLDRAIGAWQKAQVLHDAPSWKGQPEARAIAEQLAASHPECESALASLLFDSRQLVVGYALLTLELMKSPSLQKLPSELLQRRSNITLVCGSIKTAMDIGGLARQVQKRAKVRTSKGKSTPPAS
jgi:hypothetical protein